MSKKIRVLIVDDSKLIREIFTFLLNSDPEIEVVGTAENPYEARDKIKSLNPDVLTLDIEMPKMDGISFLQKIMSLRPMPVIMASSLTLPGAEATIAALEAGAIDYISKPSSLSENSNIDGLKLELISKVKAASSANFKNRNYSSSSQKTSTISYTPGGASNKVIAIGSSTGGVEALKEIIPLLPANCPPVLIAQHITNNFVKPLVNRLSSYSKVKVWVAEDNQKIMPGNVYFAPGNYHLEVNQYGGDYSCKLNDAGPVKGYRPSVDILFNSVAKIVGNKAVGVVLTGMGKDGSEGMLNMKQKGAYNIGQNEESCVIYGMPKAAKLNNAIDIEVPLHNIANEILKNC